MGTLIQVQNNSTVMADARIKKVLRAVQAQLAEDVAPIWHLQPARLQLLAKGASFDPGAWRLLIADTPEQVGQQAAGAAGDHDDATGVPTGYVFAKVTLAAKMDPDITISHEVLEMAGDCLMSQAIQWADHPHGQFLAQELCDPVEDDSLAYTRQGVRVSNFVTPDYFIPGSPGPWDFCKVLKGPFSIAPGGYQLAWVPTSGWNQVVPQGGASGRAAAQMATAYSRRARRLGRSRRNSFTAMGLAQPR